MHDTNDTEPTVDGGVDFQEGIFLVPLVQEGNDFPIFNNRLQNDFLGGEGDDGIVEFNQKGACEAVQNEIDDAGIFQEENVREKWNDKEHCMVGDKAEQYEPVVFE